MSDIELIIAEDFEKAIRKNLKWFKDLDEDDIFEISHELVQIVGNWKGEHDEVS